MHRTPTLLHRSASPALVVAAAGTVGDPEGTRTITSIVALLVAIGLALVMIAIWLFKTTRPDPDLLAPLEMMGERKWRRSDPVWQRRRLDSLRPEGAEPLEPVTAPPDIDEAFDLGPTASGFDDLHDADDEDRTDGTGGPGVADSPGVDVGDGRGPIALDSEPPTPEQMERPSLDDLPEGDVDPAMVAAAMAELDAELGASAGAHRAEADAADTGGGNAGDIDADARDDDAGDDCDDRDGLGSG